MLWTTLRTTHEASKAREHAAPLPRWPLTEGEKVIGTGDVPAAASFQRRDRRQSAYHDQRVPDGLDRWNRSSILRDAVGALCRSACCRRSRFTAALTHPLRWSSSAGTPAFHSGPAPADTKRSQGRPAELQGSENALQSPFGDGEEAQEPTMPIVHSH
jgi:hypothetical protein